MRRVYAIITAIILLFSLCSAKAPMQMGKSNLNRSAHPIYNFQQVKTDAEEDQPDAVSSPTIYKLSLKEFIYQNPVGIIVVSTTVLLLVIACLGYVIFLRSSNNKRVFRLLYQDELTGIWNLNYFLKQVKHLLNSDKKIHYAMVYTDIEHFKDFNDSYGYEEGNRILILIADIIRQSVSQDEYYARASNDNFVALLKYHSQNSFLIRLKNLEEKISLISKNEYENYKLLLTSGIYQIKPSDTEASHVLDCANDARKTVKGLRKSTYAFFTDQLQNDLQEQREIEAMMEAALKDGQFIPYFQPKIDLKSFQVVGAEALVRWQHPERGLIPPNSFVPLFEKNGFIVEMDFYIFESVCKTIRNQLDEGKSPVPISSNFSRVHFSRPDFIPRLMEITTRYQVPPNLLELEITENMMNQSSEKLLSVLDELRIKGFLISMDDFGSGYSSLILLKDMPIDILKLDKEFLQKGIMLEKDRIIIEGFVKIAQKLKIRVVSEGVETREQVKFLCSIGCNAAQGYLFAKPLPLNAFENYLYQPNL